MELILHRKILNENSTEGNLYIRQPDLKFKWFCHVIEDKVRAKPGEWKKEVKVFAKTAIPYGRYQVLVTWSNRFKRMLTQILNVPDFEGIRIHNGHNEISSAGCPIISYKAVPGEHSDAVVNDPAAMNDLCALIEQTQKKEKVFIEIVSELPEAI